MSEVSITRSLQLTTKRAVNKLNRRSLKIKKREAQVLFSVPFCVTKRNRGAEQSSAAEREKVCTAHRIRVESTTQKQAKPQLRA